MKTPWWRRPRIAAALVAVLLVLILIVQNTQAVTTRFLFFTLTMPNAVLIGIALLIGIAAGLALALVLSGRRGGAHHSGSTDQ
ncbi:MAG: lipopolysaccharide assembly protein LapA domain-containing protein [Thioalkalivibrio sp.]